MARQQRPEPITAPPEHRQRALDTARRSRHLEIATYTTDQVCQRLSIARRTFFTLRREHKLVFLEEVQPRLGRRPRYRADLVEQYAAGEWGQPRAFGSSRRSA